MNKITPEKSKETIPIHLRIWRMLSVWILIIGVPTAIYFVLDDLSKIAKSGIDNEQIDKIKGTPEFSQLSEAIKNLKETNSEAYRSIEKTFATNIEGFPQLRAAEQGLKKYDSAAAKKARTAINQQIDSLMKNNSYGSFNGKNRGAEWVVNTIMPNTIKTEKLIEDFKDAAKTFTTEFFIANRPETMTSHNYYLYDQFDRAFASIPNNVPEDEVFRFINSELARLDTFIKYRQKDNNMTPNTLEKAVLRLASTYRPISERQIHRKNRLTSDEKKIIITVGKELSIKYQAARKSIPFMQ